jgi:hypothetical protein
MKCKVILLSLIVLSVATIAEAARKSPRASCAGGSCALNQTAAPTTVGWPWSPPAPAPRPTPNPAPVVVVPVAPVVADLVIEVPDRPGRQIIAAAIAAVVRAPVAIAKAIKNRQHRPVAKLVKAVGSRLRR